MAEKIFIADKTTLDAVKVDTANIKAKTDLIPSNTTTITNLVNQVDTRLIDKFDSSKVRPFSVNQSASGASSFKTLYSVSGKGILSSAFSVGAWDNYSYFRITIDGVVTHFSSAYGSNAHGIFNVGHIFYNNSDSSFICRISGGIRPISSNDTFPSVSGNNKSVTLTEPLFFKNSLVIEGYSYNEFSFVVTGGLY